MCSTQLAHEGGSSDALGAADPASGALDSAPASRLAPFGAPASFFAAKAKPDATIDAQMSAATRAFIPSPRPHALGSSREELTEGLDERPIGADDAFVERELLEQGRAFGAHAPHGLLVVFAHPLVA